MSILPTHALARLTDYKSGKLFYFHRKISKELLFMLNEFIFSTKEIKGW